ncbi:MAG: type II 3-dehydroquinate dehydratase [Sphingomonadales bacterium]|jgi:3-dehydroquinate dehydratase-2
MVDSSNLKILVLNGPNLNLLGSREPEIYGHLTINDIAKALDSEASRMGAELKHAQSNSEGALIDYIHDAAKWADGLIFNPGGYSHTSIALRDAIVGTGLPTIEVHLSNIHAREEFRHKSYISAVAVGVICGLGASGYFAALHGLIAKLGKSHVDDGDSAP